MNGVPVDFQISYDRYVQFCGQKALKYQRCRNTMWNSVVFEKFFKKKKIRWIFQRVRGKGPLSTKHIEPITQLGDKEGVNMSNFPSDFGCPMWGRIIITGTIESQGGSWNNHGIYVEKIELAEALSQPEVLP